MKDDRTNSEGWRAMQDPYNTGLKYHIFSVSVFSNVLKITRDCTDIVRVWGNLEMLYIINSSPLCENHGLENKTSYKLDEHANIIFDKALVAGLYK